MTTVVGFDAPSATMPELRDRIKLVVTRIARTSPDATPHVQWRDEAQRQSTGTKVNLHARSIERVAMAEKRTRFVKADVGDVSGQIPIVGTEIKNDIVIHKRMVLQVLVECFDQTTTANLLADQIRDELERPWALVKLDDVGLALQDVGNTIDLPRSYDKRIVSVVAFDITLGFATLRTQEDFDATAGEDDETDADTWIETVIVNEGLPTEQRIILTETP